MRDTGDLVSVHAWPANMRAAVGKLCSDQAFTVISVTTPETEIRTQARALIRVAVRHTLGAFLEQSERSIVLESRPGEAMRVDSARGVIHVSLSHMAGLSVAAIRRSSPIGIDVMHVDRSAMETSDWRQMASDYLGPSASDLLHATPPAQRAAAFATAWTRHESCLKCNGMQLTEWNQQLALALSNCEAMALALPERCRGSVAMTRHNQQ